VLPVQGQHHCLLVNPQNLAVRHRGCRPHAQGLSCQGTFPEKFSLVQYAQGGFLAIFGYNREPDLAFLDIEDCVRRIPLREDCLLLGKGDDFATFADGGEEVYLGDRRSLIFCDPHAVAMRTGAQLTSA